MIKMTRNMGMFLWSLLVCLGLYVAPSCQQVPMDLMEQLSNYSDPRQVIENLLQYSGEGDDLFIKPGSPNPDVVDIIAGSLSPQATCNTPIAMSVEIPKSMDPNVVYYPTCVIAKRCGGCGCGHDMLECAPLEETVSEFQVMEMTYPYPGASTFTIKTTNTPIEMVEHTKCRCRCRVQEQDCNPAIHLYEQHSCRCTCIGGVQQCPSHQMWSNEECRCVCPRVSRCLYRDEEFFNHDTCSCEFRSSFVQIVDVVDAVCEGHSCRPGYRAVAIDGVCQCRIQQVASDWGVQAGSLAGEGGGVPNVEEAPAQSRPTRPSRPSRPSRPGRPNRPGGPIRETGIMLPGVEG